MHIDHPTCNNMLILLLFFNDTCMFQREPVSRVRASRGRCGKPCGKRSEGHFKPCRSLWASTGRGLEPRSNLSRQRFGGISAGVIEYHLKQMPHGFANHL